MRPPRNRCPRVSGRQVFLRTRPPLSSNHIYPGSLSWPQGPRLPAPPVLPLTGINPLFRHSLPHRLTLIYSGSRAQTNRRFSHFSWRKGRPSTRYQFRHRKHLQSSIKPKGVLNPSDPLNLQDLVKETERRRVEGLSPLRGDSRLNTPAVSSSGHMDAESPMIQPSLSSNIRVSPDTLPPKRSQRIPGHTAARFPRNARWNFFRGQRKRQLPLNGNYVNYYNRRDPNDRLPYLMPEWFNGKDVADYGCHNGTLTFSILERFPDVHHIDAIDCDADLIATARNMQRERLRWNNGSGVRYDKINFQVGNWINQSTPTDDPEYDTIVAFSVTKWIHLNHGDAGLLGFFRRAFNLLKPGGHLLLEPQPKSSYKRTRFTARQRSTFKSLKIDPTKLEPLLADLGFSYFDTIKLPRPNESFRRKIILCSKSYGATPAAIRNNFRSEVHDWNMSPSPQSTLVRAPPPVCYDPQTPSYTLTPNSQNEPWSTLGSQQVASLPSGDLTPSVVFTTQVEETTPYLSPDGQCEPDSTSAP